MLVFIEESGDPGFKVPMGSSLIFAAAMVIFRTKEDAASTADRIRNLQIKLSVHPEFKFSQCRDEIRDAFFAEVAASKFVVRAIVVPKDIIRSPKLRSNKEAFYRAPRTILLSAPFGESG